MGHDWAEDHHDIALIDNDGRRVASARVAEGVAGVTRLQEILAGHDIAMGDIVVGTETDRGLFIGAVIAGGAEVYAVNPKVAERYRDRIRPSGTKSDTLDALVLAEMENAEGDKRSNAVQRLPVQEAPATSTVPSPPTVPRSKPSRCWPEVTKS